MVALSGTSIDAGLDPFEVVERACVGIAEDLQHMKAEVVTAAAGPESEFDGVDEAETVRVVIDGRLRVRDVEVLQAELDDEDEDDDAVASPLGMRVLEAFFRGCAAATERTSKTPTPPPVEPSRAPQERRILTLEEYEEAERRVEQRLSRPQRGSEHVVGEDATARVQVTVGSSGSPINIEVNEGWAQDAAPTLIGRVIVEAFRDAYARLNEEQH